MIHLCNGNIFNSDAEALVNPVNCIGVMGKGLALQFSREFPRESAKYMKWAKAGNMWAGIPYWVATDDRENPQYIVHFPTKNHWRDKSNLEDIIIGLENLKETIVSEFVESIAIPPLGCGLGGLKWWEVKGQIEALLAPLEYVKIYLYSPEL